MILDGKTIVVTGGGSGIGKAISKCFAEEGAKVAVADLIHENAQKTADQVQGLAVACDVAKEADIKKLVTQTEKNFGPIDLFFSNAGVCFGEPNLAVSASNDQWQKCWDIHVMAHVYAARAVLPSMIERGVGYLLQMASAAGLLNQIGDAAYSTTKHATVGFAESLAITHRDDGIKVSVICPQYVATPMLGYKEDNHSNYNSSIISPQEVAESVVKGIEEERFLILPHPKVEDYRQRKAVDYDRWISGMCRLRSKIINDLGATRLESMHKLV